MNSVIHKSNKRLNFATSTRDNNNLNTYDYEDNK